MPEQSGEKKRVVLPDRALQREPLTREHLHKSFKQRLADVYTELAESFDLLKSIDRSVTFFGSSRFTETNVHYKQAQRIAGRLAASGFAVITGGGPGIMEAANKGAYEAGGRSIGFNIELPMEQNLNAYTTEHLGFHYFFTRKVAMAFAPEAYIYFPGGFGTLDEFFEILTLVQTRKIEPLPIILVGVDYWKYVDRLVRHELYQDHQAIDRADMQLYTITDDDDEVIDIVTHAPL